jgi:transposase
LGLTWDARARLQINQPSSNNPLGPFCANVNPYRSMKAYCFSVRWFSLVPDTSAILVKEGAMGERGRCLWDAPYEGSLGSYFGVDLHKDQITWHCIRRNPDVGLVRTTGRISTSRILEDFVPMLGTENSYVIVEASCSTFFFHSLVEGHCTKAFVVNPSAFREMYMTGKKTDRIDAKKLADRLMYHVEMNDPADGFPEVFVPDEEALKIRRLVTTYELLVKQMTQLKNQLKAVLRAKMIHEYEDALDSDIPTFLDDCRLDNADSVILRSIKAAYDSLHKEKDSIKHAIMDIGVHRFRREAELLTTISGVSVMGAIVFMSDIVTVDRFKTAKNMTSYLASVGKVDSSGKVTRDGGLNKRGRRTSYRFILQGLEHIVNGNEGFKQFKDRHASKKANKVRAAIVRKTFVAMYYMLKNDDPYRFMDRAIHQRKLREINKIMKNVA